MSATRRPSVIAITGGARGIGLATARTLHAQGHRVAIGDLDGAAAATSAAAVSPDVVAARVDVADRASFSEFFELVEGQLGPVDVLVNNAGIMPIGPFVEERETTARKILEVNVLGCLNGMAVALPGMLARRHGHVINVASVAGRAPVPGGLTYAASKAAIVSATETARVEHATSGVSFTCVMPSFTATELIAGTKGTRFVRTIEPDDVAAAIADTVERPRPDVFVPRAVGPIVKLQPLLGRRVRDAVQRAIGGYDTFLDVDARQRAAYDARVASPQGADPSPSVRPLA